MNVLQNDNSLNKQFTVRRTNIVKKLTLYIPYNVPNMSTGYMWLTNPSGKISYN